MFFEDIRDGWECAVVGHITNNEDNDSNSECSEGPWIILVYIISNVIVLESIDKLASMSSCMIGRTMSTAVTTSFIALAIYDNMRDYHVTNHFHSSMLYQCSIGIDVLSAILLIIGLEVYSTDSEPNIEVMTSYASISPK